MALKDYWYPWTPSRFRADTMHLSALQDGIYRRLIDHYMETKDGLPDNDIALARIAGVSVEIFGENSEIIRGFFKAKKDGRLAHKKCDSVLAEQGYLSKKNAENGKKGGIKKAENAKKKQGYNKNGSSGRQKIAKRAQGKNLAHDMTGHESERTGEKNLESESLIKNSDSRGAASPQNQRGSFSIEKFLRDEDREAARKAAPGWGVQTLIAEFDDRVNSGRFNVPAKPVPAFLAWAKKRTNEKSP